MASDEFRSTAGDAPPKTKSWFERMYSVPAEAHSVVPSLPQRIKSIRPAWDLPEDMQQHCKALYDRVNDKFYNAHWDELRPTLPQCMQSDVYHRVCFVDSDANTCALQFTVWETNYSDATDPKFDPERVPEAFFSLQVLIDNSVGSESFFDAKKIIGDDQDLLDLDHDAIFACLRRWIDDNQCIIEQKIQHLAQGLQVLYGPEEI